MSYDRHKSIKHRKVYPDKVNPFTDMIQAYINNIPYIKHEDYETIDGKSYIRDTKGRLHDPKDYVDYTPEYPHSEQYDQPLESISPDVGKLQPGGGGWVGPPAHPNTKRDWYRKQKYVAFKGYFDNNPAGFYMAFYAGKSFYIPSGWSIMELQTNNDWKATYSIESPFRFRYVWIGFTGMNIRDPVGFQYSYGFLLYPCLPFLAYVPKKHKTNANWILQYKQPKREYPKHEVSLTHETAEGIKTRRYSVFDWKGYMADYGHSSKIPRGL